MSPFPNPKSQIPDLCLLLLFFFFFVSMASNKYHELFSPSSYSFFSRVTRYDVFLSFRGTDTRKIFTDHLYIALKGVGINAYRDDNELPRGSNIEKELFEAIQDSGIALIVLSEQYASSSWCLDELVKIMECKKRGQQLVYPIFYHVNPSVVRRQTGSFADAFVEHEKHFTQDKISTWRNALTQTAYLAGFTCTDRLEGEFIKDIVEEIKKHVSIGYQDVAKYPVGLGSRVQELDNMLRARSKDKTLCARSNDVRIIGICAMGGIGKTTIAKAFYNYLLPGFQYKGFLDVRASSKNGYLHLQNDLLSQILKSNPVGSIPEGTKVIEKRLNCTRVLIVLDDVDHLEQLTNLAIRREREKFASGSRIIITTRDEHLLTSIKVDCLYMVKELNDDDSLELFCWHAFSRYDPEKDYVSLSKNIISYCKGLPLALTVLGSLLFERKKSFWEGTLKKLKSIPNPTIHQTLKISFDALDCIDQNIFLDVACFFIGADKDYVHAILDGCGFIPDVGITVLISRCLLTVNKSNKMMMHDLLRDMGREIVREKSLNELGNYSRLWLEENVLEILRMQTKGTKAIEGLALNMPTLNEEHLSTEAFADMCNLRLLQLNYVHLTGGYDNFSKKLRWVCWHGFPFKFIPNNFHVENLVAIDMRYSNLRQFSKEIKVLEKLKMLNLSHSHYLNKTPNFSKMPNLEKLKLKDCPSLVEVHDSIGGLHRLVSLNLSDCKGLKTLPPSFCMLKTLEILNLSGCSGLEILPKDLGKKEPLNQLPAIRQVLACIEGLKNIKNLSCGGFTGLTSTSLASTFRSWVSPKQSSNSLSLVQGSLLGLTSLTSLSLNNCNLLDETIPKDLTSLSSLNILNLGKNNFYTLPASFSKLSRLWNLNLDSCTRLQSLPELPTSLRLLDATSCKFLESLPDVSRLQNLSDLVLSDCPKLVEVPGFENMGYTPNVDLVGCNNLASSFKEYLLQARPRSEGDEGCGIRLSGKEIPSRFSHRSMGSSVSFKVPPSLGYRETLLDVCVILMIDSCQGSFLESVDDPHDETVVDHLLENPDVAYNVDMWVAHLGCFVFRSWDEIEIRFSTDTGMTVIKCGVHQYARSETIISDDDGQPGNWVHRCPEPMTFNSGDFTVTIHTKRKRAPIEVASGDAIQPNKRPRCD